MFELNAEEKYRFEKALLNISIITDVNIQNINILVNGCYKTRISWLNNNQGYCTDPLCQRINKVLNNNQYNEKVLLIACPCLLFSSKVLINFIKEVLESNN